MNDIMSWISIAISVLMPFVFWIVNNLAARIKTLEGQINEIENRGLLNDERISSLKDKIETNSKLDDQLRQEVIARNNSLDKLQKATDQQNSILFLIADRLDLSDLAKKVIE